MATIIKQQSVIIKCSNPPKTAESITCMGIESNATEYPINMMWIYSNTLNLSKENFMPSNYLQTTLSDTLNHFPILSGRLTVSAKGDAVIHLTNEGILYTEAECVDQTLDYFIPQTISVNKEFDYENINKTDLAVRINHDWTGPCVSIQITRLKCNSVILSVSAFHCLFDTHSAAFFINTWASAKPPNLLPMFDKSFILYSNVEEQQEKIKSIIRPKNCVLFENMIQSKDPSVFIGDEQQQRIIYKVYHFSTDELKNIKNEASRNLSNSIDYISTYDALYAHLIFVIAQATQTSLKDHVKIIQAFNGRSRFISYSSNVLNYFGSFSFPLGDELPTDQEQTLSSLAQFIHEMYTKQTEQSLREYNTYLMSGNGAIKKSQIDADVASHDFLCTSWRKFNMFGAKFMNTDYPIYSGPINVVCPRYFVMMDANATDESINITLGLGEQDYERMIQQNILHKYR